MKIFKKIKIKRKFLKNNLIKSLNWFCTKTRLGALFLLPVFFLTIIDLPLFADLASAREQKQTVGVFASLSAEQRTLLDPTARASARSETIARNLAATSDTAERAALHQLTREKFDSQDSAFANLSSARLVELKEAGALTTMIDAAGNEREIEPDLVESSAGTLTIEDAPYALELTNDIKDPLTFGQESAASGQIISASTDKIVPPDTTVMAESFSIYRMDVNTEAVEGEVQNQDQVLYADIYSGTDLVVAASSTGIQENLIFNDPSHPIELSYVIETNGLEITEEDCGLIFSNEDGQAVFSVDQPVLVGNNSLESASACYQLGKSEQSTVSKVDSDTAAAQISTESDLAISSEQTIQTEEIVVEGASSIIVEDLEEVDSSTENSSAEENVTATEQAISEDIPEEELGDLVAPAENQLTADPEISLDQETQTETETVDNTSADSIAVEENLATEEDLVEADSESNEVTEDITGENDAAAEGANVDDDASDATLEQDPIEEDATTSLWQDLISFLLPPVAALTEEDASSSAADSVQASQVEETTEQTELVTDSGSNEEVVIEEEVTTENSVTDNPVLGAEEDSGVGADSEDEISIENLTETALTEDLAQDNLEPQTDLTEQAEDSTLEVEGTEQAELATDSASNEEVAEVVEAEVELSVQKLPQVTLEVVEYPETVTELTVVKSADQNQELEVITQQEVFFNSGQDFQAKSLTDDIIIYSYVVTLEIQAAPEPKGNTKKQIDNPETAPEDLESASDSESEGATDAQEILDTDDATVPSEDSAAETEVDTVLTDEEIVETSSEIVDSILATEEVLTENPVGESEELEQLEQEASEEQIEDIAIDTEDLEAASDSESGEATDTGEILDTGDAAVPSENFTSDIEVENTELESQIEPETEAELENTEEDPVVEPTTTSFWWNFFLPTAQADSETTAVEETLTLSDHTELEYPIVLSSSISLTLLDQGTRSFAPDLAAGTLDTQYSQTVLPAVRVGDSQNNTYTLDDLTLIDRDGTTFSSEEVPDSANWLEIDNSFQSNQPGAAVQFVTAAATEIWVDLLYSPASGRVRVVIDEGSAEELISEISLFSLTSEIKSTLLATGLPATAHTVTIEILEPTEDQLSRNLFSVEDGPTGQAYFYPFENSIGLGSSTSEPSYTTGKFDSAANFQATNANYVDLISEFNSEGIYTVVFLLKTTDSEAVLMDFREAEGAADTLTLNAAGEIEYANLDSTWNTNQQVNDGIWHQVIFTHDDNQDIVKLYIDGEQVLEVNSTADLGNNFVARIGGSVDGTSYYTGLIDDLGIWQRGFTTAEIAALNFDPYFALASIDSFALGQELVGENYAGTVESFSGTTLTDSNLTQDAGFFQGYALALTSGEARGQTVYVTDFANGTLTFTPDLVGNLTAGDGYQLIPDGILINGLATRGALVQDENSQILATTANFPLLDGRSEQGTISLWVKPNFAAQSTTEQHFILDSGLHQLYYDGADKQFHFALYDGEDYNLSVASLEQNFAAQETIHLACGWSQDSGLQLFVNGEKTTKSARFEAQSFQPEDMLSFGATQESTQVLQGVLTEPQIFDYVLADTQIYTIYQAESASIQQAYQQSLTATQETNQGLLFNAPFVQSPGEVVGVGAGQAQLASSVTGTEVAANEFTFYGTGEVEVPDSAEGSSYAIATTPEDTTTIVAGFAVGPDQGIARVTINPNRPTEIRTEIDTYAAVASTERFFLATALAAGEHVVKIEGTGRQNPAATDTIITPSFLEVEPTENFTAAALQVQERLVSGVLTQAAASLPTGLVFPVTGNLAKLAQTGAIEFWVQGALTSGAYFLDTRDISGQNGLALFVNGSNQLEFAFVNESATINLASSDLANLGYDAQVANHIVLGWFVNEAEESFTQTIYLNGQKVAENSRVDFTPSTQTNLVIGNNYAANADLNSAAIYDFATYARALTDGGVGVGEAVVADSEVGEAYQNVAHRIEHLEAFAVTEADFLNQAGVNQTFILEQGAVLADSVQVFANGGEAEIAELKRGSFAQIDSTVLTAEATTLIIENIVAEAEISATDGILYLGNENSPREKIYYARYSAGTFSGLVRSLNGLPAGDFPVGTIVEIAGAVTLTEVPAAETEIFAAYKFAGTALERSRSEKIGDSPEILFLDQGHLAGWQTQIGLPAEIITQDLIAYYPFDNSLADESGNANNGLATGDSTYVENFLGQTLVLDGDGDAFQTNGFDNSAGVYTLSFWFRTGDNEEFLLDLGGQQTLRIDANGRLTYVTGDLQETFDLQINTGFWQNLTLMHDNGEDRTKIYLQGILLANFNDEMDLPSSFTLRIGTDVNESTFLKSEIDDLAIWTRELSPSEINAFTRTGRRQVASEPQQTALAKLRGTELSAIVTTNGVIGETVEFVIDEGTPQELNFIFTNETEVAEEKIISLATNLTDDLHTVRAVTTDSVVQLHAFLFNGTKPLLVAETVNDLIYEAPVVDLSPETTPDNEVAGAVSGNTENTKLLIQSQAENGSTEFFDSSTSEHTINAFGNVQHVTVSNPIGESAIWFDGEGSYLAVPASTDFELGTQDYTLDFWVQPNFGSEIETGAAAITILKVNNLPEDGESMTIGSCVITFADAADTENDCSDNQTVLNLTELTDLAVLAEALGEVFNIGSIDNQHGILVSYVNAENLTFIAEFGQASTLNFAYTDGNSDADVTLTSATAGTAETSWNLFSQQADWEDAGRLEIILDVDGDVTLFYGNNFYTWPAEVPNQEWTHLAFSRLSGETQLFLNGVQIANAWANETNLTSTEDFVIGRNFGGDVFFPGYLNEIRLTIGEALYTENFTSNTAAYDTVSAETVAEISAASPAKVVAFAEAVDEGFRSNVDTSWFATTQAAFPERVNLISTEAGLQMFAADQDTLWLDFVFGSETLLGDYAEKQITAIAAAEGQVFLGLQGTDSLGILWLDFENDEIKRLNSTGLYLAQVYTFTERNTRAPVWEELGTDWTLKDDQVNAVAYSAEANLLAVASATGVTVLDLANSKTFVTEADEAVTTLHFAEDGDLYFGAGAIVNFVVADSFTGDAGTLTITMTQDLGDFATAITALVSDAEALYLGTAAGVEKLQRSDLARVGEIPYFAQSGGANDLLFGETNVVQDLALNTELVQLAVATTEGTAGTGALSVLNLTDPPTLAYQLDVQTALDAGLAGDIVQAIAWGRLEEVGESLEQILVATETGVTFVQLGIENQAPALPTLVQPLDGAYVNSAQPTLQAFYSDSDVYDFGYTHYRITDTSLADCLIESNVIASGSSDLTAASSAETSYTMTTDLADGTYYWCAQNDDENLTSAWQEMGSFLVNADLPLLTLTAGPSAEDRTGIDSGVTFDHEATGNDGQVSLAWSDPASSAGGEIFYYLIDQNPNPTSIQGDFSQAANPEGTENLFADELALVPGNNYFHLQYVNSSGAFSTEQIFALDYWSGPSLDKETVQVLNLDDGSVVADGEVANYDEIYLQPAIYDAQENAALEFFVNVVPVDEDFITVEPTATDADGLGNPVCASSVSYADCDSKVWFESSATGDYSEAAFEPQVIVSDLPVGEYQTQVFVQDDGFLFDYEASSAEALEEIAVEEVVEIDGQDVWSQAGSQEVVMTDYIPVDPAKIYSLEGKFKSQGTTDSQLDFGLLTYDADKVAIEAYQVARQGEAEVVTSVTGMTLVTQDTLTGWAEITEEATQRYVGIYYDGDTDKLPDYVVTEAYTEISGDTLTLATALPAEVEENIDVGTTVILNHYGTADSPLFVTAHNVTVPAEWTYYEDTITGESLGNNFNTFRPETEYVRIYLGLNMDQDDNAELVFDNIVFQEVASVADDNYTNVIEDPEEAEDYFMFSWSEDLAAQHSKYFEITETHLEGYIWHDFLGWLSLGDGEQEYSDCTEQPYQTAQNYGILNDGAGNLCGYAYFEAFGWVSFMGENYQVQLNVDGELRGVAYSEALGPIYFVE